MNNVEYERVKITRKGSRLLSLRRLGLYLRGGGVS